MRLRSATEHGFTLRHGAPLQDPVAGYSADHDQGCGHGQQHTEHSHSRHNQRDIGDRDEHPQSDRGPTAVSSNHLAPPSVVTDEYPFTDHSTLKEITEWA
jgi:hypothetical protein